MPGKTGRPKLENPKNKQIVLRITEQQAEELQYCSDKLGICRTAVIFKGVEKVKDEIK